MAEAIARSKGKLGIESGNTCPDGFELSFVDYPFTKEDVGFEDHIEKVKRFEPELAVSPDIEKGRTLEEAIRLGDRLLEHADDVVIVPKTVRPEKVPERFVVGYANATFGSDDTFNSWRHYQEADRIHILGGTPLRQQKMAGKIGEGRIFSVDTASFQIDAKYGGVWTGRNWTERPDLGLYERVTENLNNMWSYWNEPRGLEKYE